MFFQWYTQVFNVLSVAFPTHLLMDPPILMAECIKYQPLCDPYFLWNIYLKQALVLFCTKFFKVISTYIHLAWFTHFSILSWKTPWTEEPIYSPWGQKSGTQLSDQITKEMKNIFSFLKTTFVNSLSLHLSLCYWYVEQDWFFSFPRLEMRDM